MTPGHLPFSFSHYNEPMARRRSDWRFRRMKAFKNAYNSNAALREDLEEIDVSSETPETIQQIIDVLLKHKASFLYDISAVYAFLASKPIVREKAFMDKLMPPIVYWNKFSDRMGASPIGLQRNMTLLLTPTIKKFGIPSDQAQDFAKSVIDDIALNTTVLQIQPYVIPSEIPQILSDYRDDLEPMLRQRDETKDVMVHPSLLGSVQPPKSRLRADLISLIMQLADEKEFDGKSKRTYAEIEMHLYELKDKGELKHIDEDKIPNANSIKTIVSRERKNKK